MNKNNIKKIVSQIKSLKEKMVFDMDGYIDNLYEILEIINNPILNSVEGQIYIKKAYEPKITRKQLIENNAIENISPKCENIFNDIWITIYKNEIIVCVYCHVTYKNTFYDENLDVEILREKF